jgi:hypothetical protein
MVSQDTASQILNRILSRCWSDASYKAKLLADPAGVFKAEGLPMPKAVELCVLENTAELSYLVIPVRPAELTDEALDAAAGGASLRDQLLASSKHKPRL